MTEETQTPQDRPLVTFALFAYNQEKFIREAVEGAFSQTYEPLEIILSDDCSSDRTFEIMQEMAATYDGPHDVKVRRNEENRKLAGHLNAVSDVAHGEIIVMAAGDDISLPKRTALIVAEFQNSKNVFAVLTDYYTIPKGVPKRNYGCLNPLITSAEIICAGGGVQIGATYAYKTECFRWPRKVPDWLEYEDRLLPFRAMLLGTVRYIDQPLILYRVSEVAQNGLNKNRVHAYNNPLHLHLLKDTVLSARSEKLLGYMRAAYLSFFLDLLGISLKRREMGPVARIESLVILSMLRLIRRISNRTAKYQSLNVR